MRLSVIVPSYKDPLLQKTVDSLLGSSELKDELEVIVVLDGYELTVPLSIDSRVKAIQLEVNRGMRGAINAGLREAKGDFVMKSDSHCLFGQGYDRILTGDCLENWLVVPRRYSLDEVNWRRNEDRPFYDYHYFSFPKNGSYGYDMSVIPDSHISCLKKDALVDDTMAIQGSCWLADRGYFMGHVGLLDDRKDTYGTIAGDQLEICLKYWLNGGEVKADKSAWYAHLTKVKHHYSSGMYGKGFKKNSRTVANHTYATRHWMNDEEPGMAHGFEWLIEKFWPIPSWEADWKKRWETYGL